MRPRCWARAIACARVCTDSLLKTFLVFLCEEREVLRAGDGLRATHDGKLAVDVFQVRLHGLRRDDQGPSDLLIGPTLGHQLQDRALARGQGRGAAPCRKVPGADHARTQVEGSAPCQWWSEDHMPRR